MSKSVKSSSQSTIKIIKCSNSKYWYNDFVGVEFLVDSYSNRDFYVRCNGYLRSVLVIDALLIN